MPRYFVPEGPRRQLGGEQEALLGSQKLRASPSLASPSALAHCGWEALGFVAFGLPPPRQGGYAPSPRGPGSRHFSGDDDDGDDAADYFV